MMVLLLFHLAISHNMPLNRYFYHNNKNGSSNIRVCKGSLIERTKKMAANLESAIRKIKDTTQEFGKNISARCFLNDEDRKQYEQLVIRKKYPYLDFKDLEMKLNPTNKHVRHNEAVHEISSFNEANACEANDESISVEIFNRGLSGVSIPNKNTGPFEFSIKNVKEVENLSEKTSESVLDTLKIDIDEYLKRKGFDLT
ncbi:uncharacterized protein LOC110992189 [Pieris rapae]|uniref:uncharacterized protein LOC110992189 n=1 Tax=Pieris rapae TaxID=64459 RepID=UPI001E27A166|nr:uncharacterized protein LOC110992189 [Pieris rapae]